MAHCFLQLKTNRTHINLRDIASFDFVREDSRVFRVADDVRCLVGRQCGGRGGTHAHVIHTSTHLIAREFFQSQFPRYFQPAVFHSGRLSAHWQCHVNRDLHHSQDRCPPRPRPRRNRVADSWQQLGEREVRQLYIHLGLVSVRLYERVPQYNVDAAAGTCSSRLGIRTAPAMVRMKLKPKMT